MDLQEEYHHRRKLPAYLIRYVERGHLILRRKERAYVDHNRLHISINCHQEPNHPAYFSLVVAADPVIYANADFSQFSFHHTKILSEQKFEWDDYERGVMAWIKNNAGNYEAVSSEEAIFDSWEMFLSNYDSWLANFLPNRIISLLAASLSGEKDDRIKHIGAVEEWLRTRYDRVYSCWRNVRQNLDNKNYADWLGLVVNDMAK